MSSVWGPQSGEWRKLQGGGNALAEPSTHTRALARVTRWAQEGWWPGEKAGWYKESPVWLGELEGAGWGVAQQPVGPHGRLVSRDWQGAVGFFPQGCALGTEVLFCFFLKTLFIYFEREGRKKERERNINRLPLAHSQLGTWSATQACAVTGN